MIRFYPFVACVLFLLDIYFYLLYVLLISEADSPLKFTGQSTFKNNQIRSKEHMVQLSYASKDDNNESKLWKQSF